GATVVVGVNRFTDDSPELTVPAPDYTGLEADQAASLSALKSRRDHEAVARSLDALRAGADKLQSSAAAESGIVERIVDAVRVRATVGEIAHTLRQSFGTHDPAA
ncbi:MAG: methylmalonyl-CoA mutase family protein, partial [Gemmatimonadaceae bacterium]